MVHAGIGPALKFFSVTDQNKITKTKQLTIQMIQNYKSNITSLVLPFAAIIGIFLLNSCSDNGSGPDEPEPEIEVNTVEDVNADGQYAYFSLRTGEVVDQADSASINWDLAFNGTTILVNSGVSGPGSGGAIILDVPFESVSMAPSEGYAVDGTETLAIPTGSDNGWYTYTGQTGNPPHAVFPLPDKTIVVRTADGNHYAKFEVITYYKGNPDTTSDEFVNDPFGREGSYYTFRYAIQLTEGLRELQ